MNFTSVDRGLDRDRFGVDADLLGLFIVGLVCRRSLLCCAGSLQRAGSCVCLGSCGPPLGGGLLWPGAAADEVVCRSPVGRFDALTCA